MNDGPKVFQVGKNEAFREKQVSYMHRSSWGELQEMR